MPGKEFVFRNGESGKRDLGCLWIYIGSLSMYIYVGIIFGLLPVAFPAFSLGSLRLGSRILINK